MWSIAHQLIRFSCGRCCCCAGRWRCSSLTWRTSSSSYSAKSFGSNTSVRTPHRHCVCSPREERAHLPASSGRATTRRKPVIFVSPYHLSSAHTALLLTPYLLVWNRRFELYR
jgi:hypothetical protein